MTPGASAILVLGMHRSGTSAVARLLNLRGAELGRDLLPAKEDNERGFWENRELLRLHERFLADSGLQWQDLADPPAGWQAGDAARRFIFDLPQVLEAQFGDAPLLAVKDPRLSRLAPLWIEALRGAGLRALFVIVVRHPAEVAASLARRDGFAPIHSHLLWLQHVVEAERSTRAQPRTFVHYERLLADWPGELERMTRELAIDWPAPAADFAAAATAYIAPPLRHHRGDAAQATLPALVEFAYEQACRAAAGQAIPTANARALDARYDDAMQLIAPLYRSLDEQAQRQAQASANEIAGARANIESLAAEIAQARAAHAERDALEAQLRTALDARDAEIDHARTVYRQKELEVEAARQNIDALAAELAQARAVIAGKDAELAQARAVIAGKDAELAEARAVIAGKDAELATARATIAAKDREIAGAAANIDSLTANLDQANALVEARNREIEARDREIDAARRNVDDLAAQIDGARAGFAAKEAEIAAARGNIDALVGEIGRAREAHALRDQTEAGLRAELGALRQSRWFRLGKALRILDRNGS
jgi:hypothetical protein